MNDETPNYSQASVPPPIPADGMRRAASVMGADLEHVNAGGAPDLTMVRPNPDRRSEGPLAAVLRDRLAGSSEPVDS